MKKINFLLSVLFLAVALDSCTSTMKFTKSNVVPAATGDVKVKKDKNDNYDVTVTVHNLAEPKQLSPAKDVYVVWMESDRNELKKLGQIVVSSGTFSSTLKGEFNTTTTTKPDKVFITAENNGDINNPVGQTVLTTR